MSPAARAAGILGWQLKERHGTLIVRARLGGQNGFLPHFIGAVESTPTGSVLVGKLHLSWFARAFTVVWLAGVASVPILVLVGPLPEATLGGRLAFEVIMLPAAVALFSVGLYVATRAYQRPAAAFREMLTAAAAPERTGELPLSVEPGASNVR